MSTIKKPMLAVSAENLESIKYPILASTKLDGIRCLIVGGIPLSRKFKPIPNHYTHHYLMSKLYQSNEIDGELIVGETFQSCSSGIMTESGQPNFTYNVFDLVDGDLITPFHVRYAKLKEFVDKLSDPRIKLVEHVLINSAEELLAYEERCLAEGHEGVMVRSLMGPYKCGRSTCREGYLLKWKRFTDIEVEVIGFEEQYHNANEAMEDELGHTKRSTHQENMVPMNTLGALRVKMDDGTELKVGTGFVASQRRYIWDNQAKYLSKMAKVKFQEVGVKDKPRFPVFLGWRHEDDFDPPAIPSSLADELEN